MNGAAVEGDGAALAIDHVIGLDDMLVDGRGVRHQLERRSRLIDIAHRVIAQKRGSGVPEIIGIEGRPDRQRENLAGVHILNDHRPVIRFGALHRSVERFLGDELDVFVDRENEIFARLWLALGRPHHVAARIDRCVHAARLAMQS